MGELGRVRRVLGRLAAFHQPWHLVAVVVMELVVVVGMEMVVVGRMVEMTMMLKLITRLFQTASLCPR